MRREDLRTWARRGMEPIRRRPRLARVVLLSRRCAREFRDDDCQHLAAAVSYHVLFSIFPLVIVAIGVFGIVTGSPHVGESVITKLLQVLPLDAEGQQQLRDMVASISGAGGAIGLIGLVGVAWSASGVMAAVRAAVNIAWDVDNRRPFLRGKAVDLLLLSGTLVLLAGTFGLVLLVSLTRRSADQLPGALAMLAGPTTVVVAVALVLTLLTALFAGLYFVLPAVPVRPRDAVAGAVVAAVGTGLLQLGFSIYVSNFAHYNRVYGSLGAIVAFLFFIYLVSMVFLFGAEVASEIPRLPESRPEPGAFYR